MTQDFAGPADKEGNCALKAAIAPQRRRAPRVRELKMSPIIRDAWRLHTVVQQFEAHQAFAWEYRENYDAMPPLLRKRLDESRDIRPADYDEAQSVAEKARVVLCDTFGEVDVILALSAPGAAPKGLDWTGDPRFNRLWTLMGTPCVNVPAFVAEGNLPVGVQVIADYGDDAKALAAARFLEKALKG